MPLVLTAALVIEVQSDYENTFPSEYYIATKSDDHICSIWIGFGSDLHISRLLCSSVGIWTNARKNHENFGRFIRKYIKIRLFHYDSPYKNPGKLSTAPKEKHQPH